jgi:CBS domain-containing protein
VTENFVFSVGNTLLPSRGAKVFLYGMPLSKVSVSVLLSEKSASIYCIDQTKTVAEAVAEMNRYRIGSLVVQSSGSVCGIFTERDILTRVISSGRDAQVTLVREVMTKDFQFISPETPVGDAMQLMTDKRVRHLPVLESGKLVGMISIGDVTRWLLKVNQVEAENLRRYVSGEYPG